MSGNAILVTPSKDEGISTPEPGLRRQVMTYSPAMMLVRHTMIKGWAGARHSHPHEQMVYIVRGRIRFEHPGGIFDAGPGDSFLVPGNVEHRASVLEDSEVLDIFAPMRDVTKDSAFNMVEAAGVEPASEIAVSQESPCSVRFRRIHVWRSERTRCARS